MALFNTELRQLSALPETVAGTAEDLSTLENDVRVRSVELSTLEVEYSDSTKYLNGDHTHSTVVPGVARGTIDSSVQFARGEWIATGTTGAPVWTAKIPYDKYLYSAGLLVTETEPTDEVTEDGNWEFYPSIDGDCNTITEELVDVSTCGGTKVGIGYSIAGAMSTLTIESTTAGAPFTLNFSTQGKVNDVREILAVNLPVFDDGATLSTESARMLNTNIRITELNFDGSDAGNPPVEFCSNVFTLDTGNTIAEVLCNQDAFGIKQNVITMREPTISIEPLMEAIDDWDFWGAMIEEKIYKIELINYADDAKTIVQLQIVAPRAQLISNSGSDDNGFRRLSTQFRLLRNIQGADAVEKQKDFSVIVYGNTVDLTTP